jgi:hypothetical protein
VPAITSRRAAWLTLAVVVVGAVLVAGCGGGTATSTAASTPTSSTLAPTTTTIPQLSGEEVAWLDGLTKLKETLQKKTMQISTAAGGGLTPELMVLYGKALGSCGRELARLGPASDRLRPVAALAKKACQQFSKSQRCHATAARLSNFGGGVLSGSPQERPWKRAVECASAAEEKGRTLLAEAQAKGVEITVSLGGD